jgi:hypothetical protein
MHSATVYVVSKVNDGVGGGGGTSTLHKKSGHLTEFKWEGEKKLSHRSSSKYFRKCKIQLLTLPDDGDTACLSCDADKARLYDRKSNHTTLHSKTAC